MKPTFKTILLITMFTFCLTTNGRSGANLYDLKTCTGIDTQGNTFDGAKCKDIVDDGPCDKESICYEPDDDIPYQ